MDFDKVFGLDLDKEVEVEISRDVEKLVAEREKARKKKDWKTADELRKKVNKEGYILDDTKAGEVMIKNA